MINHIGIVGGGQLGRMLTQAAKQMGFKVTVLDPTPNSPAGQVADAQIVKSFKDPAGIRELEALVDFMTFEIESANAEVLAELAQSNQWINPAPATLNLIKDKFGQKEFLAANNIPVADFAVVNSREEAIKAGEIFGYPFLLKARFDAYDGRGNALVKSPAEIDEALAKLKQNNLYAEKLVPFVKELAVVAARGVSGEVATYPVVETIHQNNICHLVIAPAPISAIARARAEKLAAEIMIHLKGVGVFCVEMFLTADDQVLVNEIAPRVHNSGHYTIEANATSQFAQHIRAITGQPLGPTNMVVPQAVMINILGERNGPAEVTGLDEAANLPGVAVHVYGKLETRLERKMGHITVVDEDHGRAYKLAEKVRKLINI